MLGFVAGFGMVLGALCGVAMGTELAGTPTPLRWNDPAEWWELALLLFIIPIAAATLVLDALNRVRPRRWLDSRVTLRGRLALLGTAAGLVTVIAMTAGSLIPAQYAPSWLVLLVSAALATLGTHAIMPSRQDGCCVQCGYDVRDGGLQGRCPECGSLDPI